MQVDISLKNARIYNVDKVDIVVGEKFILDTDLTIPSKWFSDNDPVLSLAVGDISVEGTADKVGTSTILIMDENFQILKTLKFNVVEAIVPMASKLVVIPDAPELK